jgi:hypothetical protein
MRKMANFGILGTKKTKPIYSYYVVRDAYCVNEIEKTNPILAPGFTWGQLWFFAVRFLVDVSTFGAATSTGSGPPG